MNGASSAYERYLMGNYAPAPPVFVEGKGASLYDRKGRRYIDFACGIATTALGHGNRSQAAALGEQAGRLVHVSNLYRHDRTTRVARLLTKATGMKQAYFCNSGAEANECALKLARKRGTAIDKKKYRVVSLTGSFHGRIGLALAASGQPRLWQDFGPQPAGFRHVSHDAGAIRDAFDDTVCAAIVEPIQGEGGLRIIPATTMKLLARLCRKHDALLIIDEIQTGMGRTGALLASSALELKPDVVTMGKGVGCGFPVAATLLANKALGVMQPGDHGSTMGGTPLALTAVETTLRYIDRPAFLRNVAKRGDALRELLEEQVQSSSLVQGVRGRGLLAGLALDPDRITSMEASRAALKRGVLTAPAGDNVLRILPPLNVTAVELKMGMRRLAKALRTPKA